MPLITLSYAINSHWLSLHCFAIFAIAATLIAFSFSHTPKLITLLIPHTPLFIALLRHCDTHIQLICRQIRVSHWYFHSTLLHYFFEPFLDAIIFIDIIIDDYFDTPFRAFADHFHGAASFQRRRRIAFAIISPPFSFASAIICHDSFFIRFQIFRRHRFLFIIFSC